MKRTLPQESKITLTVRTEEGVISLDMGLQGLSKDERKFLFTCVAVAKKGGAINFDLAPAADDAMHLTFRLTEPDSDSVKLSMQ